MPDVRTASDRDAGLTEIFERLANFVVVEHSLDSALQLVVDLAGSAVRGAEGAGISLKKRGKVLTAVSTSKKTVELDELQYAASAGPCLQAIQDGETQLTQSLLTEKRWPEFTSKALYAGAMSILAVPIRSSLEVMGALNLYSSREKAFSDTDVSVAESVTARSSVVLLNARMYDEATELASQLQEALESRAVIDQAKGIIMATEKISADAAFDRIKSLSQAANIKVRDLARGLVEQTLGKPAVQAAEAADHPTASSRPLARLGLNGERP